MHTLQGGASALNPILWTPKLHIRRHLTWQQQQLTGARNSKQPVVCPGVLHARALGMQPCVLHLQQEPAHSLSSTQLNSTAALESCSRLAHAGLPLDRSVKKCTRSVRKCATSYSEQCRQHSTSHRTGASCMGWGHPPSWHSLHTTATAHHPPQAAPCVQRQAAECNKAAQTPLKIRKGSLRSWRREAPAGGIGCVGQWCKRGCM